MQDELKASEHTDRGVDDSDADAFAILALLAITFFAVSFTLNS